MAISLSGLDLSFLKTNPLPKKKGRPKKTPAPVDKRATIGWRGYVLPDLNVAYNGGFESPIDGTFISSRAQLREHNIRHDVIQAGDIRGERLKNDMKKHMRYDPSKRNDPSFSWVSPSNSGGRSRSGNLTEI